MTEHLGNATRRKLVAPATRRKLVAVALDEEDPSDKQSSLRVAVKPSILGASRRSRRKAMSCSSVTALTVVIWRGSRQTKRIPSKRVTSAKTGECVE